MNYEAELNSTLDYLASDDALKMLEADPYWSKWDAPFWRMLLLHEMGETAHIPRRAIEALVNSLNRLPSKIFSDQTDRTQACHCQIGNAYQLLFHCGVDVDSEVPWMRPWFFHNQMSDGGLNCDYKAYLITNEIPSSMVGTLPPFEAVLNCTKRPWNEEEKKFLQRAADFLIGRQLRLGSSTTFNAAERESAKKWFMPCFPRFYFYDVLRGLKALVTWSEKSGNPLLYSAFIEVYTYLKEHFGDGYVRVERRPLDNSTTYRSLPSGEWVDKQPVLYFSLLTKVSEVGLVSTFLSKEWHDVQKKIEPMLGLV